MYAMDELKRDIYTQDPDFERNMRLGIPFGHATRMAMFTRAATELRTLAKQHRHVLADEALHLGIYRDFLRTTLAQDGLQSFFIWVHTSPSIAEERLLQPRAGHMLQANALPMLRAMRLECDSTQCIDATVHNDGPPDQTARDVDRILSPLLV